MKKGDLEESLKEFMSVDDEILTFTTDMAADFLERLMPKRIPGLTGFYSIPKERLAGFLQDFWVR